VLERHLDRRGEFGAHLASPRLPRLRAASCRQNPYRLFAQRVEADRILRACAPIRRSRVPPRFPHSAAAGFAILVLPDGFDMNRLTKIRHSSTVPISLWVATRHHLENAA
jgi:hypothetical protein